MNVVNGREREIVELLHSYGLNAYGAKVYFTLLVAGESKANDIAHKAGVPQSKVYDVLACLCDGGFAQQAEDAKPALYRAHALEETTERVVARRNRETALLQRNMERLNRVVEAATPIHQRHEAYRLFAPRYRTWRNGRTNPLDNDTISSETVIRNQLEQTCAEQEIGYKRKTINVKL